jgi:hypothetical protein
MYGFPSQTQKETFQALETIRRLFDEGVLHSAFWHCFALTEHSGIARDPQKFSITIGESVPSDFARNELPFDGHFDHDTKIVGEALRSATYNYMHGMGFEIPVNEWLGAID